MAYVIVFAVGAFIGAAALYAALVGISTFLNWRERESEGVEA